MNISHLNNNIESGRCIDGFPHFFIRSDGTQLHDTAGYGGYVRTDVYYCNKCPLMHAIVRRHHNKAGENRPPDWYTDAVG